MVLTFDTETTTYEKGNPFSRRNRLCSIVWHLSDHMVESRSIEYDSSPYGGSLRSFLSDLRKADLVVGFNLKFDLHWLRRYLTEEEWNGLVFRCWDCQLAEFVLSGQQEVLPSLGGTCDKYGLPRKLDVVSTEYWAKGLDTPDVPWEILDEYQRQDVVCTRALYDLQVRLLSGNQLTLVEAQNDDLLVLQEAEWNGMLFNQTQSLELGATCRTRIDEIDTELREISGVPDAFNWNSGDDLSCLFFGGTLYLRDRVPTERVLKDGTIKHGEKWGWREHSLPQLVRPPERGETLPTREWNDDYLAHVNAERMGKGQKPFRRVYSTDEPTLRTLASKRKVKKIIALLQERTKLDTLVTKYYQGLPDLIVEKDWDENTIHGQFNQAIAATGRLTSNAPNLQNFAGDIKPLFYSRYP